MLFKTDLLNNIVFDQPFNQSVYDEVLQMVDLNYDIVNNTQFQSVESEFGQ